MLLFPWTFISLTLYPIKPGSVSFNCCSLKFLHIKILVWFLTPNDPSCNWLDHSVIILLLFAIHYLSLPHLSLKPFSLSLSLLLSLKVLTSIHDYKPLIFFSPQHQHNLLEDLSGYINFWGFSLHIYVSMFVLVILFESCNIYFFRS